MISVKRTIQILFLLILLFQNTLSQLTKITDVIETINGFTTHFVVCLAYHPAQTHVAVGGFVNPTIWIYDTEDYNLQFTLTGAHTGGDLYSLNYSPDGTQLASTGQDGNIVIWNTTTGNIVTLVTHTATSPTRYGQFSPDGTLFISVNDDNTAKVYQVGNYNLLTTLPSHTESLNWGDISNDNSLYVTASNDDTAIIWNAVNSSIAFTLTGHTDDVKCAIFSPDGTQVATGSVDFSIKIWSSDTGNLIKTMAQHTGMVNFLEYSADGRYLVSASEDETVRYWDIQSGYPIFEFVDDHTEIVYVARISTDQRIIASGSRDNSVIFWILNCEYGQYYDIDLNCLPCMTPCEDCVKQATLCTACIDGYALTDDLFCSVTSCSDGQYLSNDSHTCEECNPNCATCSLFNNCLTCAIQDNEFIQPPLCDCQCGIQFNGVINCVTCNGFNPDGERIFIYNTITKTVKIHGIYLLINIFSIIFIILLVI